MKKVRSWDWSGLENHVRELLKDIEMSGEAVDDLYMVWNTYGPGTYNRKFMKLTKNALKRAFSFVGVENVRIRHGKNGRIVVVIQNES